MVRPATSRPRQFAAPPKSSPWFRALASPACLRRRRDSGAKAQLFTIDVTEEDRREAERSFRYYDHNRDGKIDAEEMGRSRFGSDLPVFDGNHDGVLTLNEMEYRYARRRMENTQDNRSRPAGDDRRGGDDRRRGGDDEKEANATESADGELKSYRRKSPIERLPEGMPEWFARDDADGDGQVAMNEFSASWTRCGLGRVQSIRH